MVARRTALLAGLAYLGLAISGMVGFLVIRSQLFVEGDAAATLANLVQHDALARAGIAANLTIVVTQALAALLFFRLFRDVDDFAAGSLAAFGMMNAAAILVGTTFSATALAVATGGAGGSDVAGSVLLLYELEDAAWAVGSLFFGLWLVPMGWLAMRSASMPRLLGWILVAGGVGYVLSAYTTFLPDAGMVTQVLTIPATIGEFWMIGLLLTLGMRRPAGTRPAAVDDHLDVASFDAPRAT